MYDPASVVSQKQLSLFWTGSRALAPSRVCVKTLLYELFLRHDTSYYTEHAEVPNPYITFINIFRESFVVK